KGRDGRVAARERDVDLRVAREDGQREVVLGRAREPPKEPPDSRGRRGPAPRPVPAPPAGPGPAPPPAPPRGKPRESHAAARGAEAESSTTTASARLMGLLRPRSRAHRGSSSRR